MHERLGPSRPYSLFSYDSAFDQVRRDFAPLLGLDFLEAPKVLIVDDRSLGLSSTASVLSQAGFRPVGCLINPDYSPTPGTDWGSRSWLYERNLASQIFQSNRPVAAVCDKGLGRTDGIEFCRALNELTPTIMLTGEPQTRETHRVGSAYFEKPYDKPKLISTLCHLTGFKPQ